MKTEITRVFTQNNFPGLIASIWGFFFGSAVTVTLTVASLAWLGSSVGVMSVGGGLIALLTLLGCLMLLSLEWGDPSVTTPQDFLKTVLFAFKAAVFMPFIVIGVGFFLLTLRFLLPVYAILYRFLHRVEPVKSIREALHTH